VWTSRLAERAIALVCLRHVPDTGLWQNSLCVTILWGMAGLGFVSSLHHQKNALSGKLSGAVLVKAERPGQRV
jgi:hypothetical protein